MQLFDILIACFQKVHHVHIGNLECAWRGSSVAAHRNRTISALTIAAMSPCIPMSLAFSSPLPVALPRLSQKS